jgi:hypothetical protein
VRILLAIGLTLLFFWGCLQSSGISLAAYFCVCRARWLARQRKVTTVGMGSIPAIQLGIATARARASASQGYCGIRGCGVAYSPKEVQAVLKS